MKGLSRDVALAALIALGVSAPAHAGGDDWIDHWKDRKVEVSTMTGAHLFADGIELGVPDAPGTPRPKDSVLFGVRALYRFRPDFAIEGELDLVPTSDTLRDKRTEVIGWRVHVVAPLGYEWGPLNSQLDVGFGALSITGDGTRHDEIADDTDMLFHWGVTGRWMLSPSLHIRVDARHLLVPSTKDFRFTSDFEFQAGVAYLFSYGAKERKHAPPPDPDGDGIRGADDKCPVEPEDRDGFEDDDGCPEPGSAQHL